VTAQAGDVFEAPTASENFRLDNGYASQATPEVIARDILKSSFTPDVDLTGIKVATMTGQSEMFGADYSDGTTKPWFNDLFGSVQLLPTKVSAIPVSAIASDFVNGEIVTGATGVGRVVIPTESTDTNIYVVATTTGFTAETITGDIAGSATATGVEVDAGWSYKFDSSSCIRLSAQSEEDGLISQVYNAVPTMTIACEEAGQLPKITYEISGVINTVADVEQWMRDGSMTDLTGFRSEVLPPRWVDARNEVEGWTPVTDSTFTLDLGVAKKLNPDANNVAGAEGYGLTGRSGTIATRVNTPTNVEFDFVQKWFNADALSYQNRFGQEVNNTFWIFGPTARIENATAVDAEGEMKQELQLKLTGQDDQELEIVCI